MAESEGIKTHRSGVVVAQESDTIEQILDRMASQNLGSIIVVRDGKPAGIFTERDLLRRWRSLLNPATMSAPIASIMTSPVMSLKLSEVGNATEIMYEKRIRHIPVVDAQGHLVGIVSARDILASAANAAKAAKASALPHEVSAKITNVLHLIAPEHTLISACKDLLPPGWKTSVHGGAGDLMSPSYWKEKAKSGEKNAVFIDIDGLQSAEWKALLRQLLSLLTQTEQPKVFLVWSPGKVAEKDLESLRTVSKSAKWRAYERPISLGQLIDDLKSLAG